MTQYVKVEIDEGRAYTYGWDGEEPLKPGDQVVLPSNMVRNRTFSGRVLRILAESDFKGPIKNILSKVNDDLESLL
jgi:hypothetical protein